MGANGHCHDFLDETRLVRYDAARIAAGRVCDQLIVEMARVEHGDDFSDVEPKIMELLGRLLAQTFEIVTARPVREICQSRKELQ